MGCNYYRGRALAKCLILIQSRYFRANEDLISWKIGLLSNFYLFICLLFSVKSDKWFVKIGEIVNVNLYSTIVSCSALFVYERFIIPWNVRFLFMSLSLQELLKLIGYAIIILFAVLSISRDINSLRNGISSILMKNGSAKL